MTAKLTEQELQEAAAEAGISPEELRRAMVEQVSRVPARTDSTSLVHSREIHISLSIDQAAATVQRHIERLSGNRGHRQGPGKVDILDESHGFIYRILAQEDGRGGSLVHVVMNPSPGRGRMILRGTVFATVALAVMGLGYLLSFFTMWVLWIGLGIGALGATSLFLSWQKYLRGRLRGRDIIARALVEAEVSPAVKSRKKLTSGAVDEL